ncbi:MAG: DUF1538 domain-containing protein [Eubacteriales bacterium]|nr:DUF1538 domain-containing protein [Eubacteriales bacterium]
MKYLMNHTLASEKIKESFRSVLPILLIVLLLCFTISPIRPDLLLCFLIGALLIVVGMGLFSLGADVSMTPIGNRIGTALTKSRNLSLILAVSFALGFAVSIAEPDLQVLAQTVPHINTTVLLVTVSIGVGFFLSVCMLRIMKGIRLRWLLLFFYGAVFVLAAFAPTDILSIAFDSGGVTTGPMTVPFILALGVGISNIRSDSNAEADSFGLVSLCSIGPILAVLVLGFFFPSQQSSIDIGLPAYEDTGEIAHAYLSALPTYFKEMAVALLPILLIFLIFQIVSLHLPLRELFKILIGILYTYIGLVLFLLGVNVGFSALGAILAAELAVGWTKYLLIPLSMLLGWFIISAEPAVAVLEKQIEEVSAGAIPGKAIKRSLSVAIALAMGLSMLRVLTGISILWFLIPGYFIALALTFFVPDIYTAIAFDSGGVASGPMTATFMLQFMLSVSSTVGGNPLSDAFGVVAMVAMMPLISIQVIGVIYSHRFVPAAESYEDDDIIELWEEKSA